MRIRLNVEKFLAQDLANTAAAENSASSLSHTSGGVDPTVPGAESGDDVGFGGVFDGDDDASMDSRESFVPDDSVEDLDDLGFAPWLWSSNDDDDDDDEQDEDDVEVDIMEESMSTDISSTTLYGDDERQPVVEDDVVLTDLETATLQLLMLCDASGARRGLYDEILTLLRRFRKKKLDITKAKGREAYVKVLEKKIKTPKPKATKVGGRDVIHFSFLESLRDLLRSTTFDNVSNLCVNTEVEERFNRFQPATDQDIGEIMSKRWASESQDEMEGMDDFDPQFDLFLAIMMYGDKTGTDVNQRYPLEPWVFTLPLLRRAAREKSDNWRHLGFIPSQDSTPSQQRKDDDMSQGSLSTEEKLQQYHDYLAVLLNGLKIATDRKPIMWVNLGGEWQRRRLHIKVCVVSGDQKSQDYICGRMSVNGGHAGRVHRGCMASAVNSTSVGANGVLSGGCRKPPTQVLKRLNDLALLDVGNEGSGLMAVVGDLIPTESRGARTQNRQVAGYLSFVKKLAKTILTKVFSMHPHRNAFDGLDFGANAHGILVAATEDHLHSCESGVMLYFGQVAYFSLTPSDRNDFEKIIRSKVTACRSSVMSDYPRGTVKSGFGRLTLCSHKEKVGSVFYLLLALHDKQGRELFEKAKERQQEKYLTFPTKRAVQSLSSSKSKSKPRKKRVMAASDDEEGESDIETDEEVASDDEDGESDIEETDEEEPSDDEEEEASEDEEGESDSETDEEDEDNVSPGGELPPSAFPYRKDLLYGTDHKAKFPFDRSDESIEFVCLHLIQHGLGFVLETELDEYQIDLLMMACWSILHPLRTKQNHYPSIETVNCLAINETLREIVVTSTPPTVASIVEESSKTSLRRSLPPRQIDLNAATETDSRTPVSHQHSLPIPDCVPKHRRQKPKIKGNGFTGAVLSDTDTFVALAEYLLCYHAWCHNGSDLPREMQEDIDLISFATQMVVQYFDTILYRGDDTVDSATCKLHSQLHTNLIDYFGDLMQYNTETGERGLKTWAKFVSRTALKHGRDEFTHSTSKRVAERLLFNKAGGQMGRNQEQEALNSPDASEGDKRRRIPHFRFDTGEGTRPADRLLSFNRDGKEKVPDQTSGSIQPEILKALTVVEREHEQELFDIWCEATLPNGEHVRCFPKYRRKDSKYDWVMARFATTDGNPPEDYPAKVLALYEDKNGMLKALVHATEYKTLNKVEGPYGDSRLVKHYRLQFDSRDGEPTLYAVPFEDILYCVMAYEAVPYQQPLVPRVRSSSKRREHTVMTILPRREWARLFLVWSRKMKERQETERGAQRYRLDC